MCNKNKLTAAVLAMISSGVIAEVPIEKGDASLEEVTVVGIRKSLRAAPELKRDSSAIPKELV
jgi:hypothetical protein